MPTNGMTIDGLNTVSSLTAQDKVPVWDNESSGEPTRKITAQDFTNSVKTLGSLVNTTEMNTAIEQSTADVIRTGDVINELTSTATDKPLSAAQGKALNDAKLYNGYMEWNSITLNSNSWATNTGADSSGVMPSGVTVQNSYNLKLDVAGTYLVIYHVEIKDSTNKTGIRGIRQYVSEININEFFFAPGGNNTTCEVACIVHSNGSDNVHMGVYQSSGGSLTVTNIRVIAVMLKRN